ncbi:MAG: LL-diaminopimelate aminotransferase [Lachnospiraceae bacterium]|nr:LL-diaminopimelate aminotransferase [Lachnospiraceae bacterium]
MFKINENYLKLPGSYLFSTIAKKVSAFQAANPDKTVIRLGIGDVTQPLAPAIIDALHGAVDEMGKAETFHGYAPDLGYEFLRTAIAKNDYADRGCDIAADEIFVSDGAKCDSGNIQEIFSVDNKIAVCDPVYPVYVDTNVMAGRTGTYDPKTEMWSDVIYMPCTEANNFSPELPKETPDIIYLCFPNNPTGATITKAQLQEWVDYANRVGAVIIYDAAYEAYISEEDVPHTIFECEGARTCAIELKSFSKNAGFTGTRLGYTVIPKDLKCRVEMPPHVYSAAERAAHGENASHLGGTDVMLHSLWARRHGTKYNGAPYIQQRAGEAVYSPEGKVQLAKQVAYYMNNAKVIKEGLQEAGYTVSGGVNAPYIWLKTPDGMTSWEFFDYLLEKANVVGTPGSGFGPSGEGYFRLTAFGTYENSVAALERIKQM